MRTKFMARRRTASTTSSSKNRFQGRGMDKFQQVYAELERKRAEIAAREGVPTTDVWFMRDANENKEDWVPVVVRKKTKHHGQPERQKPLETIKQQDQQQQQQGQSSAAGSSSSCWVRMKLEETVLDMQQAARRALKSISLFIMVIAAVANLVVAVVAELASSLLCLVKPEEQVPRSNPNPNLVSLAPPWSFSSPPSTPRLRIPPSSGSRTSPTSPRLTRSPPRKPAPSAMPFLVTVIVILLSLELGRVSSVLVALVSWFTFPALKALFAAATTKR